MVYTGYQPKRRRCDPHATTSRGPNPTNPSISTSIKSILLRKASAPSMTTTATSKQRKDGSTADTPPRPSLSKLLRQTPSIPRLSMSISTKSKISPRTEGDQHHKYQVTTTTTTTTRGHHPTPAHPRNGIPSKLWQRHSIMQPPPPTPDNRKSHHVKPTSYSSISSSLSSRIARTRKSIDLWMLGAEKKKQADEKIYIEEEEDIRSSSMSRKQVEMATLQALNGKKRMDNNSRNKMSTRCSIISARV